MTAELTGEGGEVFFLGGILLLKFLGHCNLLNQTVTGELTYIGLSTLPMEQVFKLALSGRLMTLLIFGMGTSPAPYPLADLPLLPSCGAVSTQASNPSGLTPDDLDCLFSGLIAEASIPPCNKPTLRLP